jgi:hypothetical protein
VLSVLPAIGFSNASDTKHGFRTPEAWMAKPENVRPYVLGEVSLERTILALTRSNGAFILSITRFRHLAACLLNPAPGNQAGTYFTLVEKSSADAKQWINICEAG